MDLRDFFLKLLNSFPVVLVQFRLFGIHLVLFHLVWCDLNSRILTDDRLDLSRCGLVSRILIDDRLNLRGHLLLKLLKSI